ncbi:MAG: HAMP domain-containing histidine kinase, partial [Clostridia bacterium]|nr:HAMP domain-containing histidine kinase [Clostridia bacterium]
EKLGSSDVFRSSGSVLYVSRVEFFGRPHYLLVSYSLSIVQDTVWVLQLYLLIIGVSVVLLAFLISNVFSRKLTSGLKTMSDTAVQLAKRNYSVEFNNADYAELAQLSDTLNSVRDEIKKSEDFQREILANVSHDLKTPLTMIKAYASMIKEISGDDKEKREKHLQVIIDESDRLTGLVNDVLSVSKLQSNIDEINFKVFNLTDLVYGIIDKFGYLQESQGYNLMVDIDANIYTRADESKISQVIYNLLGNAANYTGEDKTVYISLKTSMDGQRVKFSVRDTGRGIAKEEIGEIWNRYYRVKENHNRPVKGTGLGLNIVKAILENHSFDFGVDSEIGKGSCFWVDFPAVPAEI